MGTTPVFASVSEAMDMVRAGLAFIASADAAALSTEEQAETLRSLERASSVATAARTSVLTAFTARQGSSGSIRGTIPGRRPPPRTRCRGGKTGAGVRLPHG